MSMISHYRVSKNDIDEEQILKDPFFSLFSICDETDIQFWVETLKLFNSRVDWEKLCNISRNFYKKYKYEYIYIDNSIHKLMGTISCLISLIDHVDINTLTSICQKIYNYCQTKRLNKNHLLSDLLVDQINSDL